MADATLEAIIGADSKELQAQLKKAQTQIKQTRDVLARQAPAWRQAGEQAIRYNTTLKQFVRDNGQLVTAAKARAAMLEDLNRLGIKTTTQTRQEVQAINALIQAYQADARVVAQLEEHKRRLLATTADGTRGMQRFGGVTNASGRALVDFSRFAEDAAYGPRAVINNVEPLILSLQNLRAQAQAAGTTVSKALLSSLAGPAGFIALFSVASAVAVTFGDDIAEAFGKGKKAAEDAKEAAEDYRDVLRGLLRIQEQQTKELSRTGAQQRLQAAAFDVAGVQAQIRELEAAKAAAERTIRAASAAATSAVATAAGASDVVGPQELARAKQIVATTGQQIAGLEQQVATRREDLVVLSQIVRNYDQQAAAIDRLNLGLDAQATKIQRIADLTAFDTSNIPRVERTFQVQGLQQGALPGMALRIPVLPPDLVAFNAELRRQLEESTSAARYAGLRIQEAIEQSAFGAAAAFGDAFTQALPLFNQLERAQARLGLINLEDQRDRLQDAFQAGTVSAEAYSAQLRVIELQQKQLRQSLNPFLSGIRAVGDEVENLIRKLAQTAIQAAAIKFALGPLFGFQTGSYGQVFGNLLGFGGGPSASVQPTRAPLASLNTVSAAARPARPAAGPVHVTVSGRLVGEGNQLVGVIDTQSTIKSRTGRQR